MYNNLKVKILDLPGAKEVQVWSEDGKTFLGAGCWHPPFDTNTAVQTIIQHRLEKGYGQNA